MVLILVLSFAFNVLLLAALIFLSWTGARERQSLTLLVKGRVVAEFVRAEQQLASPAESTKTIEPTAVDLDAADPTEVADKLT